HPGQLGAGVGVDHLGDVAAVHPPHRLHLAGQAGAGDVVAGHLRAQHLDRDQAVLPRVVALVDHAHTALADAPPDGIRADAFRQLLTLGETCRHCHCELIPSKPAYRHDQLSRRGASGTALRAPCNPTSMTENTCARFRFGAAQLSRGSPRPSTVSAPGRPARAAPGTISLERRTPLPTTTSGQAATAASTSSGHPSGRPTGVIPPYSIPVAATASSCRAKDALRTSRRRRTAPLTSSRVVASTTQAAVRTSPPRLPVTTMQLAPASIGKP